MQKAAAAGAAVPLRALWTPLADMAAQLPTDWEAITTPSGAGGGACVNGGISKCPYQQLQRLAPLTTPVGPAHANTWLIHTARAAACAKQMRPGAHYKYTTHQQQWPSIQFGKCPSTAGDKKGSSLGWSQHGLAAAPLHHVYTAMPAHCSLAPPTCSVPIPSAQSAPQTIDHASLTAL